MRVPPLAWDVALAGAAAAYARELAGVGALRHSARQTRLGQGENLWMGTRGAFLTGQWCKLGVGEVIPARNIPSGQPHRKLGRCRTL